MRRGVARGMKCVFAKNTSVFVGQIGFAEKKRGRALIRGLAAPRKRAPCYERVRTAFLDHIPAQG